MVGRTIPQQFHAEFFCRFVGAFGGGLIFDLLRSYDLAWRLGVAIGLLAGLVQVSFALLRPVRPVPA